MGRSHQERRIYPKPQAEVHRAGERAIIELGLAVKPDAEEWRLEASQPMGTFTWGERIVIQMATAPGGGTQVIVSSKLVFGFFDWGRNKQNVDSIYSSMDHVLGPGTPDPIEE